MSEEAKTAFARTDLVQMLSQTIGDERASEAVDGAARELGLGSGPWAPAQAEALLGKIATTPGLVGMAAKFAKMRLHLAAALTAVRPPGT
jgi:hypothetical protein